MYHLIPNQMTQSNEPNDYQRDLNRRFRDLSWRVERLETSQMPARSLNESFDRVYDEIDALEDQMNARFDRLESENREMRAELNGKIDIIMRHITGQANS
jgi:predicted nuclease with TOPRIM domain